MKALKFNLLIVFLAVLTFQSYAGKEEFSKKITKSYDVNKDAVLSVKNKFGKVHCENWDNNTISIEVTITLEASNEEKANKYFNQIDILFEGSSSMVSAVTSFDDDLFDNNNHDISIDYYINVPKSLSMEINNKFGDIILNEVNGYANIDVSYGSIKAKRLTSDQNEIEIKFSEGFIGYIQSGDIELKYSELELSEAHDLSIESKFSELDIGEIDALTLESGYDDDYIGSVRDLDVESSFTDVEIRNLGERLIADCDYGEVKVKEVDKGFKLIEIENSFSDANIGFHSESSFKLIANIKMGDFSYPSEKARISVVDLSYTSNKYEGVIGSDENTSSKVIIESKNSGVNLFYR